MTAFRIRAGTADRPPAESPARPRLPPDRFRVLLYCNPDPDNTRAWAWRVAWREAEAWHTADEHGLCIPHVIGAGDWQPLPPPPPAAYDG